MAEGYGSALLQQPELIQDMVRQTKERTRLPVSIKIRIDSDMRYEYSISIPSVGVSPLNLSIYLPLVWTVSLFYISIIDWYGSFRNTIELAKRAEAIGCSWITVHGRTPKQRSTSRAKLEPIKMVTFRKNINIIQFNRIEDSYYNTKILLLWMTNGLMDG